MSSTTFRYFDYKHLPDFLQPIGKEMYDLALKMEMQLPDGPEKSAGMRKLLEANDCFVRSALDGYQLAEASHTQQMTEENLTLKKRIDQMNDFHPHAFKLMFAEKNFVVVAENEPYFPQVYSIIRDQEIAQGHPWNEEDERKYQEAIMRWTTAH